MTCKDWFQNYDPTGKGAKQIVDDVWDAATLLERERAAKVAEEFRLLNSVFGAARETELFREVAKAIRQDPATGGAA